MVIANRGLVIALPLNLLYTVRLAPKQKLGLAAVFSIGILIILVAIARAVRISRKAFSDGVLLALWGIIESTVCEYRHLFAFNRNRLSTPCCVIVYLILMLDTSFSASAVIVGCLPPFKSLFQSRSSFQRYSSPVNGKRLLPGLKFDNIRLGSAKAASNTMSRPVDAIEDVIDGRYDGGCHVPPGAIGVRNDYVSRDWGAHRKELTGLIDLFVGSGKPRNVAV